MLQRLRFILRFILRFVLRFILRFILRIGGSHVVMIVAT